MIFMYKTNRCIKVISSLSCSCLNRHIQTSSLNYNEQRLKIKPITELDKLLEKFKEKLLYCGYLEDKINKLGYRQNIITLNKLKKQESNLILKQQSFEPLPISLKYLDGPTLHTVKKSEKKNVEIQNIIQFPFDSTNSDIKKQENFVNDGTFVEENLLDLEVRERLELYNKSNNHINWMNDYENASIDTDLNNDLTDNKINYGTPNPNSKMSNVSCGGCGALLHCKDTAIPGYIPSEIFENYFKAAHLKSITCQRCYFLNTYNLALQVRVSPNDYPRVLKTIADRNRALVILIVDLLDFPCSIWPGIADLLGPGRPVVVLGNKVDLLPQDGKGFLQRVKTNLESSVRESGFAMSDIRHLALISAKTGYGIEDLITKLQSIWQYKGDVFLVGCTNVGKSSLFNALLQSDYCKSQAADLIQRATTSPWPGTTMNLLKFPILRPTGWRLHVRYKRLISSKKLEGEEKKLRLTQLRETRNTKYATLIGHIDRTFDGKDEDEAVELADPFAVTGRSNTTGIVPMGINPRDKEYVLSKWCYDTPGVVQPDQIIHLLTTEELMLMIPKHTIKPKTFKLEPMSSIFISGLARFDYLDGAVPVKFTVFCSSNLSITVCKTEMAQEIYDAFLGSEVFAVPVNYPERLKVWPGLQRSNIFSVTGIDGESSCADLVLSSAGWISITPNCGAHCTIQGWTPEKRGIYLRDCLLPKAVTLRGKKIRHSCTYRNDKIFME